MPGPPAGEPRTTDTQCQGYGLVPNCVGISIALSLSQLPIEFLTVSLALSLRGNLRGKDIMVHYGQHGDCCIYQLARWFMLLPHVATHLPPPPLESEASGVSSCHPRVFNQSRVALPGEWRLHPQAVQLIWCLSGRSFCISVNRPLPMIQLPIRGNTQHGCTGTQLALGPAQICVSPGEPASTDTVQDQGGRGAGPVSGSILAQQDLVPGTHAPRDSPSLGGIS